MKAKLVEMEAELSKLNEFEWNYPNGTTSSVYASYISTACLGTSEPNLLTGTYRIHKHNAKSALQLTKETKLIGAVAEQLFPDDDWTSDWDNVNKPKFYIYVHPESMTYSVGGASMYRTPGAHYMSESTAKAVCDVLNSGKVVL